MDESLLAKSNSFRNSKNFADQSPYYEELAELIKSGNYSELKIQLTHPENIIALSFRDPKSGSTLIHLSADRRDAECVRIILEAGGNPNIRDKRGRTALHKILSGGCRCELCTKKSLNCLDILIRRGANVNAEDKKGKTPLYYAAENTLPECAILLLDNGADLQYSKELEYDNLATMVVQRLPGVMEKEFDKCIEYDDNEKDNSKLRLDFRLILQTSANEQRKIRTKAHHSIENGSCSCCSSEFIPCETELLYQVLKATGTGRDSLLTHPLTEAFLHVKWLAVRKYFLILRSIYFFLTVLYTLFVFGIFVINCPHDWKTNGPKTEFVGNWEIKCEGNIWSFISGIVVASVLGIMVLYELYKMCMDQLMYFKSAINIAWWILIASVVPTILPAFGIPLQQWQYPLSAFAVIVAWTMNLVQMGRIPELGIYVEVLARVLKDFGLFLITYSSLLIAFALGFCILIPDARYLLLRYFF